MQMNFPVSALIGWCQRIYGERAFALTPYAYVFDFGAVTQNVPATEHVEISANADFVMTGLALQYDEIDGSPWLSGTRLLLSDSGTGAQLSSSALLLANQMGNYYGDLSTLPYPWWLAGNTSLTAQLLLKANSQSMLRVVLNGFQVRVF